MVLKEGLIKYCNEYFKMADASNLPDIGLGKKVKDADTDIVLIYTFVTVLLTIAALAFSVVQGIGGLALFAGAVVFVIPLVTSYIQTDGQIIRSNVSAPAQGFSIFTGLLLMRFSSILGGKPLSLFSVPTASGSYLGVLSVVEDGFGMVFNIFLAPTSENLFLMPMATSILIPAMYRTGKKFDIQILQNNAFLALASSVPVGIIFAFLHGARSIQFIAFASFIMIFWTASWVYDGIDGETLLPIAPLSILFSIGVHTGNNLNASPNVDSLTDAIVTLVSSPEVALQVVGYLQLAYWSSMFLLWLYFLYDLVANREVW